MLSSEAYNINSAKHVQETLSVKLADNRPCKLCRFLLAVRLYLQTDIDYLIYIKSSRLFQLDALYKLSTHKINLGPDSSLQTARRYRRSGVLSRLFYFNQNFTFSSMRLAARRTSPSDAMPIRGLVIGRTHKIH